MYTNYYKVKSLTVTLAAIPTTSFMYSTYSLYKDLTIIISSIDLSGIDTLYDLDPGMVLLLDWTASTF